MSTRSRQILSYLTLTLLISACGGPSTRPVDELSNEQRAEQAYAMGLYQQAAEYWQLASAGASDEALEAISLKTANAWLRAGRPELTVEWLARVDEASLEGSLKTLFYMARAELALLDEDPERADFYLGAITHPLSGELDRRFRQLRSELDYLQRDPFDRSLAEVSAISSGLTHYQPEAILEVLRSLESIPSGRLDMLITSQRHDPQLTEWLELALQLRTAILSGSALDDAADYWSRYHYGHPVGRVEFVDLAGRYQSLFQVPSRVAVLLPDSGGLAAAGKAIRDGIVAAFLEHPGSAALRFYSSGESSEAAFRAYQQAMEDGAVQVIGPLRIESTRMLSGLENLPVPVLLLNESVGADMLPEKTGTTVNSLTLSQSEEASQVARFVTSKNQKHALVLAPDNSWGKRIVDAFSVEFATQNGQVVASMQFDPDAADHSEALTRVLRIDESNQRKADLQATLGMPLSFEPMRRDDFEFVFMAVTPSQGRALKPLLRFHNAGDMPVFTTGRVFTGRYDPASDRDLNGVIFPSTRWQLLGPDQEARRHALGLASVRDGALGNLYSLGQDAWRVLRWLPLMRKDPDLWYEGGVGSLKLLADGRLYRAAVWAQIQDGRPAPYTWPEEE